MDVRGWLLGGDVAVAYQTHRDLLGHERPDLQARIAREGYGARLLAARNADEHWGRGFYQPKWTSSHYTLLELRDLALPRDNPLAHETATRIMTEERGRDGGLNPSRTIAVSDACVNGMALGYSAWFGADEELLRGVVDFLLDQRMADGGFNCRANRSGARHSSLHTTVCVMEGMTTYLDCGYPYRADELDDARTTSVELLLRHRMFRSERTGEVIRGDFTRLHHPARWHYDVLRGLDAVRAAGAPYDARMADGVDVLRRRQGPDGRWPVNSHYPGATHVPLPRAGTPDAWVTLKAMRVLACYGMTAHLRSPPRRPRLRHTVPTP